MNVYNDVCMSINEKLKQVTSEGKDVTAGNNPQIQFMICSVNVHYWKVLLPSPQIKNQTLDEVFFFY